MVAATAATVSALLLEPSPLVPAGSNWVMFAVLTAAAVVLERSRTDLFGGSSVSLSFVPLFAVALLLGPAAAGMSGFTGILLAEVLHPVPWYKRVFNASTVALAGMAGSALFHTFAGPPTVDQVIPQFLPAVAAALLTFFTNSVLITGAVSISTGRRPLPIWGEKFRWLAPHYAALGLASYAMAVAYLELGIIGVGIFSLPVVTLWLGVKQYADRSRADVRRLQDANTALATSEERFRSLVQNAPGFIAVVNPDGSLQYLSPSPGTDDERLVDDGSRIAFVELVRPHDVTQVNSAIDEVRDDPNTDVMVEFELKYNGSWRHYSAIVTNLMETAAVGGVVINAHDVTERKALEDQLRYQAFHDPLTSLPNRSLFMDRLLHALDGARRRERTVAVMFLDLDRFKVLNDSLGHNAGDEFLVAVAERLAAVTPPGDTVARFGGDEFTILLEDVVSVEHAASVAQRVLEALSAPLSLHGLNTVVTASIGIALSDGESIQPRDLIRSADIALFRAKEEGRGRYVVYDEGLDSYAAERFELEAELRQAVERGQFMLHYQPELDLRTGDVVGFEALIRWNHPTRGLVPPDDFISMAEETGDIVAIGRWVLAEACRQAREWQSTLFPYTPFTMSVNLSAKEFLEPDLLWRVAQTLRETELAASLLRIEITESALLRDTPLARKVFFELRALGVQIAIDDFGTGYSSLNYLRRLPADVLKIDRGFVADVDSDPREASIVQAVVNVAEALEMKVTAEGIERANQLELLTSIGCATGQGYYFSRPADAETIEQYIRKLYASRQAAS